RADRHVLPRGHRHGAGHESRGSRDQHARGAGVGRGHTQDQARGRHNAVIRAEHGSPQPVDVFRAMRFSVTWSHGLLLERGESIRTTLSIAISHGPSQPRVRREPGMASPPDVAVLYASSHERPARGTEGHMHLVGNVALVTGAQQGIGRAIALALAREGGDVGVNYLDDRGAAERVAGEIRGLGRRACLVRGDVSRASDAEAMVGAVERELGAPAILVNNAGVFPRIDFLAMTEGDWDHVLDVNLKGSFLCAQAAARRMVAAGRGGAIVNLSSVAMRGT